MKDLRIIVAVFAASTLSLLGCTSQQLYSSGQEWQKTECRKLPVQEQQRCMASAAMSYDEYKRQSDALAKPK